MSLRDEDLAALDAFAGARRLTRGDAVGVLLETYGKSPVGSGRPSDDDPEYIPPPPPDAKKALARAVLEQAQKYTGVQPVKVFGDEVVKGFDEEAERNLDAYYSNKITARSVSPGRRAAPPTPEDLSQDPEDYG